MTLEEALADAFSVVAQASRPFGCPKPEESCVLEKGNERVVSLFFVFLQS